jgi:hypothetical protein
VDVTNGNETSVTFVGDNGVYTVPVGTGDNATVSAGESHVLQTDQDGNPLYLGPIREIILDALGSLLDNVKILVIPGKGPLDDFLTAPPNTPTTIDVLGYATGAAPGAGLQPPLNLVSVAPATLTGGTWAPSPHDLGEIVYTYTPTPDQSHTAGPHPTDSFGYIVRDADGKLAFGAVDVTIDTPTQITVQPDSPAVGQGFHEWLVPHETQGPLTGDIALADAEGDPLTLSISAQALHGHVSLTRDSPTHYRYEYDPPTIDSYDRDTGLITPISAIVGDNQFTLEASDGLAVTDYTMKFSVPDLPPIPADLLHVSPDMDFVVPENTGASHYGPSAALPDYTSAPDFPVDYPGLVHFAAPGVLWDWKDPDFNSSPFGRDPLMALADPSHLPLHGQVYLFPDGAFNYTPDPGFTGTDRFGYYVSDGYLLSGHSDPSVPAPSFVTLHVVPGVVQNHTTPAPILFDDSYSLQLGYSELKGEFAPPITQNDQEFDANNYPLTTWKVERAEDPALLAHFDSVNGVATKFYNIYINYFYGYSNIKSKLQFLVRPPDETAENQFIPVLDVSLMLGPNDRPEDLFFSYAVRNKWGWYSNFASVKVHVLPPGLGSYTLSDSSGNDIEVSAPASVSLSDVYFVTPLPSEPVPDLGSGQVRVPWLISFHVRLPTGIDTVAVSITLPPNYPHYTTYYKFGHQAPGDDRHWYAFFYNDELPPIGAEFRTDPISGQQIIVLHFIDGRAGDDDLTANGTIVDPGGPGFFTDPARDFVASLYEDVLGRFPSDAEMAQWVGKLDRGESHLKVARAIWDSDEHRRLQVDQWSRQFLGHAAEARQQAKWVKLLRRGRGELAVEQAILTSPDYRRAHPTTASFLAGLNHDVVGQAGDPVDPSHGRLRRHRGRVSLGRLAREVLTSPAAAAMLAQQDATTFLGRPATSQEKQSDGRRLRRGPDVPARIAERILASDAFYVFVNSALPSIPGSSRPGRHAHRPARHQRGH